MEKKMIFSFLGLSKPVSKVNDALVKAIKDYRTINMGATSPINPGGVYVPNLEVCTTFASSRKMAAYMNMNDLIRKSDIIFAFVSDSSFKNLHKVLRRHDIKDKIFCHFYPEHDAEILDFGPDNTYVSIIVPAVRKKGAFDLSHGLIVQGYGPRYDEFTNAMERIGIKVKSLNSDEKSLYQSAVNIIKYVPSLAVESSRRLAKSVLGTDCDILELFDGINISAEYTLSSAAPEDTGDVDYIETQAKLMKKMSLEDSEIFYAALLLTKTFREDLLSSQTIKDIAKSIIRRL